MPDALLDTCRSLICVIRPIFKEFRTDKRFNELILNDLIIERYALQFKPIQIDTGPL